MMPAAPAAIHGRERSNVFIATLKPVALGADERALRDLHVLEDHVGRVGARWPILFSFLPTDTPGVCRVDDEAGDALVAAVPSSRREHGVEAGDAAVGDPALLAVEHVVVAVLLVARLHAGDVGAGVGLASSSTPRRSARRAGGRGTSSSARRCRR